MSYVIYYAASEHIEFDNYSNETLENIILEDNIIKEDMFIEWITEEYNNKILEKSIIII